MWVHVLTLLALSTFALFAKEAPTGHESMRLGVGAGSSGDRGAGLHLNYRFGLHDFLDLQSHYPDQTLLELFSLKLDYYPGQSTVFLDELTVARLVRLPPLTASWAELSWEVEVGGKSLRQASCDRCGAGNLLGGLGLTVTPLSSLPVDLWFLLEAELLVSPRFGFPLQPSIGPRGGVRFRLLPNINGMVYATYRKQFKAGDLNYVQWGTQWRWAFARNWAVDLKWENFPLGYEGTASLFVYF